MFIRLFDLFILWEGYTGIRLLSYQTSFKLKARSLLEIVLLVSHRRDYWRLQLGLFYLYTEIEWDYISGIRFRGLIK